MISLQKNFLCISRWIASFWEVSNFLQICEKNAKIRKVIKYKVYKKLVFQKSLQLIHDIWTVNISMKIELWNFCKLFCTHISLSHMGFTVMFLQVFHRKILSILWNDLPTKYFLCISQWITSFWEVSNFFANLQKNAKICSQEI